MRVITRWWYDEARQRVTSGNGWGLVYTTWPLVTADWWKP